MALNFMCHCFREVQTVAVVNNKDIVDWRHICVKELVNSKLLLMQEITLEKGGFAFF